MYVFACVTVFAPKEIPKLIKYVPAFPNVTIVVVEVILPNLLIGADVYNGNEPFAGIVQSAITGGLYFEKK